MIINPYLVQPSGPAFTGLLDTYSGAAVAYSAARRLSSTYTGSLIRVRRSSDNAEQNIGYDINNVLDEAALTTFVGANNGFVTTWYDQSGNANNAVQSTAANQPQIVSSGTINKQSGLSGSQPALSFDGVNDFMDFTSLVTTTNYTAFVAQKRLNSGLSSQWLTQKASGTGTRPYAAVLYGGTGSAYMSTYNSTTQITASTSSTAYILLTSRWGSTQSIYINNSALTTSSGTDGNSGTGFDVIGRRTAGEYSNVNNTEIILYPSDKLTDLTGISNNINTFYSIYSTFTGILDTYSGSAIAYSVARRLSSTYTGALIRVRRSSDNAEQDIGYTTGNVLDQSALTTFVGANNGFVVTMYDQSGNGKNVTQATAINQPRIVNAGSIDLVNGLPAILGDGSNDTLLNSTLSLTNPTSIFTVVDKVGTSGNFGLWGASGFGGAFNVLSGGYDFYQNGPSFSPSYSNNNQSLLVAKSATTGTDWELYGNNTTVTNGGQNIGNSIGTTVSLFDRNGTQGRANMYMQEFIVWNSNQMTNRAGIQSNINTYYTIY